MPSTRSSNTGKKRTPRETPITASAGREPARQPRSGNSESPRKKIDLVLEGGGVKGIALVGAATALEEYFEQHGNYEYGKFVGTSAGACVAALLGAGYKAKELSELIAGPEIAQFADLTGLSRIPLVGRYLDMGIGLLAHLGLFKGDYFLKFFKEKLAAKGVRTFRDLIMPGYEDEKVDLIHKYRVHMLASDITRGRMLILPDDLDLEHYGVRPDDMDVAEAVRMSIAVPGVFRPVKLTGQNGVTSYIVDGGLLSNFPVQAFDRAPALEGSMVSPEPVGLRRESEAAAAIGIRLLRDRAHNIAHPFIAARAAYALISTALEAHDTTAAMKFDLLKSNRTVNINTEAVSILKFNLTPLEREVLFNQGYIAMKNVLRPDFLERAEEAAEASRHANAMMEP